MFNFIASASVTSTGMEVVGSPFMPKQLKGKIAKIVCPLGVGAHFERWGFEPSTIIELDWNESLNLKNDLRIHALPARHYSGRTLTRNKSLWAAYALTSANHKIYVSGDSGYGSHFREAGEAFCGFDLAILDSGQYNEAWRYVHMMPEDAAQAAADLNAKALLPAHVGKFSIARHSWDDPFIRLMEATENSPFRLLTPKIGESVLLERGQQQFAQWWKDILLQNNCNSMREIVAKYYALTPNLGALTHPDFTGTDE